MQQKSCNISLFYEKKASPKKILPEYILTLDNFFQLSVTIRSNSENFLFWIKRIYGMFFLAEVKEYYRKKFNVDKKVYVDIFIESERRNVFLRALSALECCMKYAFLWGRFIILHGSCIRYRNFNIFFLGSPRSGKTTMCSAFHERNGLVVSEDCSFLETKTGEVFLFPSLGSVRPGVETELQKKYLGLFRKACEGPSLARKIALMKEDEYKSFMVYHKELYRIGKDSLSTKGNPKNIFVLLDKYNEKEKVVFSRKNPIDILPRLMENVACSYMNYRKSVKEIVEIFLNSRCYVLHRTSLDLMLSEVCSELDRKANKS